MITNTEIESFYEEVATLNLKFPVAAIAKATGFSKGNVSDYLNKKKEPSENFIKAFREKFSSTNVPRGNEALTMQALVNLTESNRTLADAAKVQAEANKSLADSHRELVSMAKGRLTENADEESFRVSPATITDLLLVIAEIGTKAGRWKTKSEAHAELHRIGAGVLVKS